MCDACVSDATLGIGGEQGMAAIIRARRAAGRDPEDLFRSAGATDAATLIEFAQKVRDQEPDLTDYECAKILAPLVRQSLAPGSMAAMLVNVAFHLANEAADPLEDEALRLADLLDLADDRGGTPNTGRTGDDLLLAWLSGELAIGNMDVLAARRIRRP